MCNIKKYKYVIIRIILPKRPQLLPITQKHPAALLWGVPGCRESGQRRRVPRSPSPQAARIAALLAGDLPANCTAHNKTPTLVGVLLCACTIRDRSP